MNILQAIADPALFGPWFKDRESWRSWRVFLAALFNLSIEDEKLYIECTGGRPLPVKQAREGYLIVGRRGGKSFIAALIGVYLAVFHEYRLVPGERGVIMILAADAERETAVLDLVRSRKPPFSPENVVQEFSSDLKRYNIHEVHGDKYAGDWPAERFQTHVIRYRPSEKTKSEIYQAMLPRINSRRVELLDDKMLRTQLLGLERHTSRGGRDSIDHRPNSHDDIINAAAGVLTLCAPTTVMGPEGFGQGVISFSGRRDEERALWDQR
jgi:hypothetical protein